MTIFQSSTPPTPRLSSPRVGRPSSFTWSTDHCVSPGWGFSTLMELTSVLCPGPARGLAHTHGSGCTWMIQQASGGGLWDPVYKCPRSGPVCPLRPKQSPGGQTDEEPISERQLQQRSEAGLPSAALPDSPRLPGSWFGKPVAEETLGQSDLRRPSQPCYSSHLRVLEPGHPRGRMPASTALADPSGRARYGGDRSRLKVVAAPPASGHRPGTGVWSGGTVTKGHTAACPHRVTLGERCQRG